MELIRELSVNISSEEEVGFGGRGRGDEDHACDWVTDNGADSLGGDIGEEWEVGVNVGEIEDEDVEGAGGGR